VRIRISSRHLGGMISLAVILSTLSVIGSAPAYGHDVTVKSTATIKAEQKDREEIAKFEADLSHLKHDLASLPPEVNSMLTYAGSGSGPLLSAATAWAGLANELQDAATSYGSIVSALTSESQFGPASPATAAAAAPFVTWMQTTAQQAEQAATQASAAAAAFEQSVKTESTTGRKAGPRIVVEQSPNPS
jgi:PPE family